MDEFDFFKDVNIKEVSKRTLISETDIIYLKNEEFDKLSKSKGLGFIKIIEREYKIDLSDKKERFLEYLKEHRKNETDGLFIAPPKEETKSNLKNFIIVLFILVVLGFIAVWYINSHKVLKRDSISQYSHNQIINETKQIIGIKTEDINQSYNSSDINQTENNRSGVESKNISENLKIDKNISDNKIADTNDTKKIVLNNVVSATLSQKNILDKNKTMDNKNNTSTIAANLFKKMRVDNNISISTKISTNSDIIKNNIILVPKRRIWVGIIDMQKNKKLSFLQDKNITIDKNKRYLILTGHGMFKIVDGKKIMNFNSKNPVRFFIDNGKIIKISKEKFLELNKGRNW